MLLYGKCSHTDPKDITDNGLRPNKVYSVLSQKEFTSRHSRSPGTSGIILVLELEDQWKQGTDI